MTNMMIPRRRNIFDDFMLSPFDAFFDAPTNGKSTSRFREDIRGMAHAMLARGASPGEIGNFVKYCGGIMDHADDDGESYAEVIASAANAQM